MDINKGNFRSLMQPWLQQASKSCFISIDLELSGIPPRSADSSSLKTLQQRYEEAKEAANKYQVLQIGFTIVHEDVDKSTYTAFPYNVLVSPLLEERLGIQRDFTLQTVNFLLNHGFSMGAPFRRGVPYLSREEEKEATEATIALQNRVFADILLETHDTQALRTVNKTRAEIIRWETLTHSDKFLNISTETIGAMRSAGTDLNNYQKRLIHQLVRSEFPHLRSTGRADFVQIIPYDSNAEKAILNAKMANFDERRKRQIGLRYFVEALVGAEKLEMIDSKMDPSKPVGTPAWINVDKVTREFEALRKSLQDHQTVLVGHNLFLDLVNFYKCFFGTLPDTIEEFQTTIHELFPLIIDTKYMASTQHEGPDARSGLEELDDVLGDMQIPVINLDPEHRRYEHNRYPHEAGFDSYLTTRVFLRLTAKLAAQLDWEPISDHSGDSEHHSAFEQASPHQDRRTGPSSGFPKLGNDGNEADNEAETLTSFLPSKPKKTNRRRRRRNRKVNAAALAARGQPASAFAHPNIYDVLSPTYGQVLPGSSPEPVVVEPAKPVVSKVVAKEDQWREKSGSEGQVEELIRYYYDEDEVPELIPHWGSEFWAVYGNRVAVNGTREGVWELE